MKIKNSKLFIACISVLLATMFVFTLVLSLNGTKANANTYKVYADDDYYSETTYYLTENAYNKHLKEMVATDTDRKTSITKSAASTEDKEFVVAATKKVCVYEVSDENGNIIESRLLKKSEIDELENQNNSSLSKKSDYATAKLSTTSFEEIGSSDTYKHYLNIDMIVKYDNMDDEYIVKGNAYWKDKLVWAWDNYKAAEEDYDDFIALSWGGEGTLEGKFENISGYYYNRDAIKFDLTQSDSYSAFVWQFREKSGWMGKEMEKATASVVLKKRGVALGKFANAKMTYIHTYGTINGSITIEASTEDGLAAGITLSEVGMNWKIEIDVPQIPY